MSNGAGLENRFFCIEFLTCLLRYLGAAFTRLQTLLIQNSMPVALNGARDKVVSYGSCQFPTLGFVVYRYLEHIGFTPETFWKLVGRDLDKKCDFTWARTRLFDERVVRVSRLSRVVCGSISRRLWRSHSFHHHFSTTLSCYREN